MHTRAALTVYSCISSLNMQRVLWALHEVRLPYELASTSARSARAAASTAAAPSAAPSRRRSCDAAPLRQIAALRRTEHRRQPLGERQHRAIPGGSLYKPQLLGAQML